MVSGRWMIYVCSTDNQDVTQKDSAEYKLGFALSGLHAFVEPDEHALSLSAGSLTG